MAAVKSAQNLPYEGFPLRRHRNGHWYKSVWNRAAKRSEQFYFGSWHDDPEGKRAMADPDVGWLARRDAIMAGIDNVRVQSGGEGLLLGQLMSRFLTFKRGKVASGELSLTTLAGYLREVSAFVAFQKATVPAAALRPEHFTAYAKHLIEKRQLGRFARKRAMAYINTFLRYGQSNGWMTSPATGSDWTSPATDPASMRVARLRAGLQDHSDRILTGDEVDRLLNHAPPAFCAMILLGVNCGLGPADLGRMRWTSIDLHRRRLSFPRPKTGIIRVGHLWRRTVEALLRVRQLKHNRKALLQEGESSLVFITRKRQPYYRESELHKWVEVDGRLVNKLVGVRVDCPIVATFGRIARRTNLQGVGFYRLRHTFKTLAKKARDREAVDSMMGHKDNGVGKIYDHEEVSWHRVRRVSRVVHRKLWPKVKRQEEMHGPSEQSKQDLGGVEKERPE